MATLPPLRKLQYVLAVARALHFRKAAEALHVSQPAISRQIKEYEEELGFEILQRDHHFVSLTKAGHSFVAGVEIILARLENDFAILYGAHMQSAGKLHRNTSLPIRHLPLCGFVISRWICNGNGPRMFLSGSAFSQQPNS